MTDDATHSRAPFVVLFHRMPSDTSRQSHWDLMVRHGDALATWALELPPDQHPEGKALRLPDHRLTYLQYEGPVGGGRGEVRRWDTGWCQIQQSREDCWVVHLSGKRLQGRLELRRCGSDGERGTWVYHYYPEDWESAEQEHRWPRE